MKKALCVFALLAVVTVANAGIDLFLTQQGATNATTYVGTSTALGSRFNQNITKISLASGATTNPGTLSHGPFNLGVATPATPVTATFYVWAHFTDIPLFDDGEGGMIPGYMQVYGMGLQGSTLSGAATIPAGSTVVYRQNVAPSYKRWDNTDPLAFPFGPATVTQSPAAGLVAPGGADTLVKDFAGLGVDYYALIGAFTYTATGASQMTLGVANPLPFLAVRYFDPGGAIVNDWDTKAAGSYYPYFTVMGQPYTSDGVGGTQPLVAITSIVPEPASMLLLGLAGLLIRRR